MLSSATHVQHQQGFKANATVSEIEVESLRLKEIEQQATIDRLMDVINNCANLAGVDLGDSVATVEIDRIPELISKKIGRLIDKNHRAETDYKRLATRASILESRLQLIGESSPAAWGLIHDTRNGVELGKCIYKTKDEAVKESALLSTKGHITPLYKHPVNQFTSFPNGFLMSALQKVESAHFRSDCDTGASHQALVVLNAFRSLAGLEGVSKNDLPVYGDKGYQYPAGSKLLGAQSSLPMLTRVNIGDIRNIALSFHRHLFELSAQDVEKLEVGFDLWMADKGRDLMGQMNFQSVAVVNNCISARTDGLALLGIPFNQNSGKPLVTNSMKSKHHGEYSFSITSCLDEDGQEVSSEVSVPWDLVKRIYKDLATTAAKEINI